MEWGHEVFVGVALQSLASLRTDGDEGDAAAPGFAALDEVIGNHVAGRPRHKVYILHIAQLQKLQPPQAKGTWKRGW